MTSRGKSFSLAKGGGSIAPKVMKPVNLPNFAKPVIDTTPIEPQVQTPPVSETPEGTVNFFQKMSCLFFYTKNSNSRFKLNLLQDSLQIFCLTRHLSIQKLAQPNRSFGFN